MASLITDDVLELPEDFVTSSSGLGIDIGGSIAKVVYRSNKEYKGGKPINEQSSGKGTLHLAMFPRGESDTIIKYISENCDVKKDENGEALVYATGIGGSQFQSRISQELGVKIKVLAEFDLFADAFKTLSKVLPKEELVHPPSPEAQAAADEMNVKVKEWKAKLRETEGVSSDSVEAMLKQMEDLEKEKETTEVDQPSLPCLIGMCGSGTGFMKILEDGTCHMVDGVQLSGRFYLGMMNLLTGVKDYSKLTEMATGQEGRSCDVFMSDLRGDMTGTDIYNLSEIDNSVYAFGKGSTAKREDIKDEDMAFSLFTCVAGVHVQIATLQAAVNKIKNVYFCGNFVNSQLARTTFEKFYTLRTNFSPPEMKSNAYFLRHGGMYGALGAYLHVPKPETTTPEKTEDTKM